jgi:hypothetical protein
MTKEADMDDEVIYTGDTFKVLPRSVAIEEHFRALASLVKDLPPSQLSRIHDADAAYRRVISAIYDKAIAEASR